MKVTSSGAASCIDVMMKQEKQADLSELGRMEVVCKNMQSFAFGCVPLQGVWVMYSVVLIGVALGCKDARKTCKDRALHTQKAARDKAARLRCHEHVCVCYNASHHNFNFPVNLQGACQVWQRACTHV